MDYYAASPGWKMPKWIGIAFGGIFSVIAGGSVWVIVDLTRPQPRHPVAVVAPPAAAPATPAIVAPAPVTATRPEQAARVEAPAPAVETKLATRTTHHSPSR